MINIHCAIRKTLKFKFPKVNFNLKSYYLTLCFIGLGSVYAQFITAETVFNDYVDQVAQMNEIVTANPGPNFSLHNRLHFTMNKTVRFIDETDVFNHIGLSKVRQDNWHKIHFSVPKYTVIYLENYFRPEIDPEEIVYKHEVLTPPVDDGPPVDETKEVETFVDEEAEFPGGYPAMMAFIKKNLVFPETAIENGVQGKCFLRFIVCLHGNVVGVTVINGVPDCPECDKAAIKVMEAMPKWNPGKLNGRIESSYCRIPIGFYIE